MMTRPDADTLYRWGRRWGAIRAAAYAELVASYTPEQQALVAVTNEAARQQRLCHARARWPEGASGKHATLVRWPQAPPE